jgi:hypothetical protein
MNADGPDRVADRGLQLPQAVADDHLGVPVALPIVVALHALRGGGINVLDAEMNFRTLPAPARRRAPAPTEAR